ncbi:MAG: helix-turn-helix domain-containing protein [Bacilli bacterium]|nr:helix-turn-helix domain-containing protein [Bacilli bacterium]
MIEVGDTLRNSREVSGVTLEEVSTDLEIPIILLEQIEDGNMGAFKDVFELKEYIKKYAKYIGLDPEELIDVFNTYMFERTSKIPMDKIEEAVREKSIEEEKEDRIASPYTKAIPKLKTTPYIIALIIAIILMILALAFSIKTITDTSNIIFIR